MTVRRIRSLLTSMLCLLLLVSSAISQARDNSDLLAQKSNFTAVKPAASGQNEKAEALLADAMRLIGKIEDESSKSQTLARIAIAYAAVGLPDQALQTAKTLSDATARVGVLADIANNYARVGQKEKATQVLLQSAESVKAIEDVASRVNALATIAAQFAKLGQKEKTAEMLSQSLQMAKNLRDAEAKIFALSQVADKYGEVGQKEKSLEILTLALQTAKTAKGSRSDYNWNLALSSLASAYSAAGQHDQAFEVARLMVNGYIAKPIAFVQLAVKLLEAGQKNKANEALAAAYQAATTDVDSPARANGLSMVGVGYAKAGQYERALKIASQIEQDYAKRRSMIFTTIADRYAKVGQKAKALQLLTQAAQALAIPSTNEEGWPPGRDAVIKGYAELGRYDLALQTVKEIQEYYTEAIARGLSIIAQKQAEAGHLNQAMQTARTIQDEATKAKTLADIATMMPRPDKR